MVLLLAVLLSGRTHTFLHIHCRPPVGLICTYYDHVDDDEEQEEEDGNTFPICGIFLYTSLF